MSRLIFALALLVAAISVADAQFSFNFGGQQQQQQQRRKKSAVEEVDYYKVLGVARSATERQIRKAYRDLSLQLHPDKTKDKPEAERLSAEKRFVEVGQAYEVLTNADKRKVYDQYGVEGVTQMANGNGRRGGGAQDIFSQFFGGGQQGGMEENRGPSITIPLNVDLADVYLGAEFEVAHKKQVLCPHCRGTGARSAEDVQTCTKCRGSGQITFTQQVAPGFVTQSQRACDKCAGKGKVVTAKCPHCKGRKVQAGEDAFFILVERGMPEGHEIKFEGEGDERPDELPGDVNFVLHTVSHRRFSRHGNDLRVKLTLSLLDALVGFEKEFAHLDGHKVPIKRDGVSKPGDVIKIPGQGMPVHGTPSEFGDLYVDISLRMPESLSPEQKDLARKLLA